MPTILALDLSTNAGYAVMSKEGERIRLHTWGVISSPSTDDAAYPFNYINRARVIADLVWTVIGRNTPVDGNGCFDAVVIEETNKGKNRYSQKMLEFIHMAVLELLEENAATNSVKYINTSDWRKILGVYLSKDDKKLNTRLSKAKSAAKKAGTKLDKKELGIRGKINKKHIAIRTVNAMFGLDFKPKDNDVADAICLGAAYLKGAPICDGR